MCPKQWEMVEDDGENKAKLTLGKLNPETEEYELEIKDEEDITCNTDLIHMRPVQIIKIV